MGNKKQYELNQSVADKIDEAIEEHDDTRQHEIPKEGKQLLLDRNKRILLAKKYIYGWDTVECYTAEPLASNAEDEKRIKKAVKRANESEKKRRRKPRREKLLYLGADDPKLSKKSCLIEAH